MRIFCAVLFLALLGIGFLLAANKPIWNDERYSQVVSVQDNSYGQILAGKISEGNNSPLFYLLQKTLHDVFHKSDDRIFLRINPVVSVSAALTLIFYFVCRWYGWGAALFALGLGLSTHMLWLYWAEARHYALWFFLSVAQICLFWEIHRRQLREGTVLNGLMWAQWLLAFTVVFSLPQILLVALLTAIMAPRQERVKQFIIFALPGVVCLYYFAFAPKYSFWVMFSCEQYIRAGIPRDRLYLFLITFLFLGYYYGQRFLQWPRLFKDSFSSCRAVLILIGGMIASSCLIVFLFSLKSNPGQQGFPVTDRYFFHLIAFGVLGAGICAAESLKALQFKTAKVLTAGGIGILFIVQVIKSGPKIQHYIQGLFLASGAA
jgi:hypothetical protein